MPLGLGQIRGRLPRGAACATLHSSQACSALWAKRFQRLLLRIAPPLARPKSQLKTGYSLLFKNSKLSLSITILHTFSIHIDVVGLKAINRRVIFLFYSPIMPIYQNFSSLIVNRNFIIDRIELIIILI